MPFVMSAPRGAKGPLRVPEVARLVDVVPTVVDLLGVPARAETRASWAGVSLLPTVRDGEPMPRLIAQGETFAYGALRWYATDGRSKVVFYNKGFHLPKALPAEPFANRWLEEHTPAEAVYEVTPAAPWDRRVDPPPEAQLRWGRELAALCERESVRAVGSSCAVSAAAVRCLSASNCRSGRGST